MWVWKWYPPREGLGQRGREGVRGVATSKGFYGSATERLKPSGAFEGI